MRMKKLMFSYNKEIGLALANKNSYFHTVSDYIRHIIYVFSINTGYGAFSTINQKYMDAFDRAYERAKANLYKKENKLASQRMLRLTDEQYTFVSKLREKNKARSMNIILYSLISAYCEIKAVNAEMEGNQDESKA